MRWNYAQAFGSRISDSHSISLPDIVQSRMETPRASFLKRQWKKINGRRRNGENLRSSLSSELALFHFSLLLPCTHMDVWTPPIPSIRSPYRMSVLCNEEVCAVPKRPQQQQPPSPWSRSPTDLSLVLSQDYLDLLKWLLGMKGWQFMFMCSACFQSLCLANSTLLLSPSLLAYQFAP